MAAGCAIKRSPGPGTETGLLVIVSSAPPKIKESVSIDDLIYGIMPVILPIHQDGVSGLPAETCANQLYLGQVLLRS